MNVKIFQLDENTDESRDLLYMNYNYIKNKVLNRDEIYNPLDILKLYKLIYETDNYQPKTMDKRDIVICDDIFTDFNINRPENFKGHSLSVSDIIQLEDKYYFVDSFGFVELN